MTFDMDLHVVIFELFFIHAYIEYKM